MREIPAPKSEPGDVIEPTAVYGPDDWRPYPGGYFGTALSDAVTGETVRMVLGPSFKEAMASETDSAPFTAWARSMGLLNPSEVRTDG